MLTLTKPRTKTTSHFSEILEEQLERMNREFVERAEEHDRRMLHDDGYRVQFEANEAEQAANELAKHRLWLEVVGMPRKDVSLVLEGDVDDTKAIQAARWFAGQPHGMLILAGVRGCGKTVAANWLIGELLTGDPEHAPSARFIDVARLTRTSRYKADQIGPLEKVGLLVIDDLGMEYGDERGSFLATLDGLINARYSAQLKTVITTNLPWAKFKKRYGERIADRLRECGRFVELDGKSLRKKGKR